MSLPALPVSTNRLGDRRRGPRWVLVLAAGFLAISLLKPWPGRATGPPAASHPMPPAMGLEAPNAASAPVPARSPEPGRISCLTAGWRLVSAGHMARWLITTWQVIDPVVARGPLDPAIPFARLGEGQITGLGICEPLAAAGSGVAGTIAAAWQLSGSSDRAAASELPLAAIADEGGAPGAGRSALPNGQSTVELVAPSGTAPGLPWPAGRYVLAVDGPGGPASRAWVGIIVDPPGP